MIINQNKRALILAPRDPTKYLNILPTAKPLEYKGRAFVAVPHRLAEYKILKNLGLDPPHPVDHYYSWPGMELTPMEAQRDTVRKMTSHLRGYCLNDIGTGKTLSTLWTFDFLKQQKEVNRLLVVAPLSTLTTTWEKEIFTHLPHLSCVVLHGSRKLRQALLEQDVDIYIINHDGIKILNGELEKRKDIDAIVIDELAQVARNAGTDRWKALKTLVEGRKWVWGLTGTPIPNEPTDAWAQCRLITPETVPPFYSHFRDRVMYQSSIYKWHPREDALTTVHEVMQPAVRHSRASCVDLPPLMYEERFAALTADQTKMWKAMFKTLHAEYNNHQISAVNEGVKMMKLVQIACGVALDNDEKPCLIAPKPRVEVVKSLIEEAAGKVIVFVPFKAPLKMLHQEISKDYICEKVFGETPKKERDRIFSEFQKPNDGIQVIVAQPGAMSHGLNLTTANVVVWYAPINSAEIYEQANGRITRPGQTRSQFIIHVFGTQLEEEMYTRLKKKTHIQGLLLALFNNS